ncbi:hypothetical protein [Oceanibium sediminis]|uniref:hypothetical protein n=1 Tax=Oceanibium sediminis TaxID=2026339 RepID=UPI00130028FC|nr:hypothetical protein [Oceanibium sediminis]
MTPTPRTLPRTTLTAPARLKSARPAKLTRTRLTLGAGTLSAAVFLHCIVPLL